MSRARDLADIADKDITGTLTVDGLTVDTDAYRRLLLTYPDAFTSKLQIGFTNFYVQGSATNDRLTIANNSSGQTHFENQSKTSMVIDNSGDISFYEDTGTTPKFFWDASAESLGIGASSNHADLHLGAASPHIDLGPSVGNRGKVGFDSNNVYIGSTSGTGEIHFKNNIGSTDAPHSSGDTKMVITDSGVGIGSGNLQLTSVNQDIEFNATTGAHESRLKWNYGGTLQSWIEREHSDGSMVFGNQGSERFRCDSSGNVGIGTSSPSVETPLTAYYSLTSQMHLGGPASIVSNNVYYNGSAWANRNSSVGGAMVQMTTDGVTYFRRAGTGASPTVSYSATIDASGNLLVGMTSDGVTSTGVGLVPDGVSHMYSAGDGDNATLMLGRGGNDGNILSFNRSGSTVGSIGVASTSFLTIGGTSANHGGLRFDIHAVLPMEAGTQSDNTIDLGSGSYRYDDVYATNGTIQTSDRNEKQDIEALNDAETRVAVACKGLLRKFRWQGAVAEKGDDARIHFGIIAQDLQDAFAAEGLDAGRYAMFISSTWTDEETGEERTRLGVRYPELLAFIIAAI